MLLAQKRLQTWNYGIDNCYIHLGDIQYISFKVRLMHDLSHINYTLTRIKGSLRKARTSELTGKHDLQQSHMIPTHHSELITTQKSPNYKLQRTKLQGTLTSTPIQKVMELAQKQTLSTNRKINPNRQSTREGDGSACINLGPALLPQPLHN